MISDAEMSEWRKDWQSFEAIGLTGAQQMHGTVARYRSRSHLLLAGNILAALVFIGGSVYWAACQGGGELALWAAVVCLSTFVALGIAVEQWRRSLEVSTLSVSDFTAFRHRRALADLRNVKIGIAFLVAQANVALIWFSVDLSLSRISLARHEIAVVLIAIQSAMWGIVFVRRWHQTQTELRLTQPLAFHRDEE